MESRRMGALIMAGAALQLLLFLYGLARRSYAAVAAPVALAVLAPAGLEVPAAIAGATWLAVALVARRVVDRGEIEAMVQVLKPEPERVEVGA